MNDVLEGHRLLGRAPGLKLAELKIRAIAAHQGHLAARAPRKQNKWAKRCYKETLKCADVPHQSAQMNKMAFIHFRATSSSKTANARRESSNK